MPSDLWGELDAQLQKQIRDFASCEADWNNREVSQEHFFTFLMLFQDFV